MKTKETISSLWSWAQNGGSQSFSKFSAGLSPNQTWLSIPSLGSFFNWLFFLSGVQVPQRDPEGQRSRRVSHHAGRQQGGSGAATIGRSRVLVSVEEAVALAVVPEVALAVVQAAKEIPQVVAAVIPASAVA